MNETITTAESHPSSGGRSSLAFIKTIATLLDHDGDLLSGTDIAKLANLNKGTIYPLLKKMRQEDWVECEWETLDVNETRPPRRMYKLTVSGKRAGVKAIGDCVSKRAAQVYEPLIAAHG